MIKIPSQVMYEFVGEERAFFTSVDKTIQHDYSTICSYSEKKQGEPTCFYNSKRTAELAYNRTLNKIVKEFCKKNKCKKVILVWRKKPKLEKLKTYGVAEKNGQILQKLNCNVIDCYFILSRLALIQYGSGAA